MGHWETYGGRQVQIGELTVTEMRTVTGLPESTFVRERASETHAEGYVSATVGHPEDEPILQVSGLRPSIVRAGVIVTTATFRPGELIFLDQPSSELK